MSTVGGNDVVGGVYGLESHFLREVLEVVEDKVDHLGDVDAQLCSLDVLDLEDDELKALNEDDSDLRLDLMGVSEHDVVADAFDLFLGETYLGELLLIVSDF